MPSPAWRPIEARGRPVYFRGGVECMLAVALAATPVPLAVGDAPQREVRIIAAVANVRSEPSATGKVLFQLKQGDTARVMEAVGRWWHITDGTGRTGYVFGGLVSVLESPSPPPPAAPAPPPVSPASTAGPLKIEHREVGCVLAEEYPKLDACFLPEESVGRAQIHFRAMDNEPWYAVDLKRDGPCFSAYLPKPIRSTKEIQYYVDVVDRAFSETEQPASAPEGAYRVRVVSKANQCGGLGRMAAFVGKAVNSIVVGIVKDPTGRTLDAAALALMGGKLVLAGFSQVGVIAAGTGAAAVAGAATGTSAGGAAAGGAGTAAGGGLSTTALILGGVGVVAAAGVIKAVSGGGGSGSSGSGGSGGQPAVPTPPPTVTGLWAFSLRCQGNPTVVAQSNITLNQTSGGMFSGSAPGTDIDGTPFTANITGNYVAASGLLSGQLSDVFASGTRIDNFSTTLSSTDTGFIPTTCTQNCACPAEVRFNRLN
jgi:hypothetical protein